MELERWGGERRRKRGAVFDIAAVGVEVKMEGTAKKAAGPGECNKAMVSIVEASCEVGIAGDGWFPRRRQGRIGVVIGGGAKARRERREMVRHLSKCNTS